VLRARAPAPRARLRLRTWRATRDALLSILEGWGGRNWRWGITFLSRGPLSPSLPLPLRPARRRQQRRGGAPPPPPTPFRLPHDDRRLRISPLRWEAVPPRRAWASRHDLPLPPLGRPRRGSRPDGDGGQRQAPKALPSGPLGAAAVVAPVVIALGRGQWAHDEGRGGRGDGRRRAQGRAPPSKGELGECVEVEDREARRRRRRRLTAPRKEREWEWRRGRGRGRRERHQKLHLDVELDKRRGRRR
jgi:hypothetical protein